MEPWQAILLFVAVYWAAVLVWIRLTDPMASDFEHGLWRWVVKPFVKVVVFLLAVVFFTSMFDKPK